jgi:hypothetical protein
VVRRGGGRRRNAPGATLGGTDAIAAARVASAALNIAVEKPTYRE